MNPTILAMLMILGLGQNAWVVTEPAGTKETMRTPEYKQIATWSSPGLDITAKVTAGWTCHLTTDHFFGSDTDPKIISITCVKEETK